MKDNVFRKRSLMKNLLKTFLIIIAAITMVVLYERGLVKGNFGPSLMLSVSILGALFFSLLITLFAYETRFWETVAKIWMVVISVLMAYLLMDLLAGYFLIKPLAPELVPDKYLHHKFVPNTYSRFEQRDFSYIQRVNNVGLRGRDIQIKKSPERYRILMLGDSFTMGKGVEDNQTFSALLEESLNQRKVTDNGKTIEVLNAGVDSYAPILSFIQLTRDLEPLDPDIVVLNVDVSDLVQETVYRKQAIFGSGGEIISVPGGTRKKRFNETIREWTDRNLYMTRFILFHVNKLFDYKEFTVRRLVTQANFEIAKHTLADDTDNREEQWRNIFDSILKTKQYCDDKGMKFLLTIYPWGHQVNEKEWIPGRYNFIPRGVMVSDKSVQKYQEFAINNKIQLLNLFPLFRSYNGNSALYFQYDNHMTTEGHKLMAKGFAQYLQDRTTGKKAVSER
jgi:lysophospholipase L1-like esterase